LAQVAEEQLGVQMQFGPQSEKVLPQRAGSFEGQGGSMLTHTSGDGALNKTPIPGLQTSPDGQTLFGSFASHGVTQAQFLPHALVASPQALVLPPSLQVAGQHTRLARANSKHAPLFSPQVESEPQSASELQPPPVLQAGQSPPQSTSLSVPSLTPLLQCAGAQPGARGSKTQGSWHVPLEHTRPGAQSPHDWQLAPLSPLQTA